jgi:hypothetical protein
MENFDDKQVLEHAKELQRVLSTCRVPLLHDKVRAWTHEAVKKPGRFSFWGE